MAAKKANRPEAQAGIVTVAIGLPNPEVRVIGPTIACVGGFRLHGGFAAGQEAPPRSRAAYSAALMRGTGPRG